MKIAILRLKIPMLTLLLRLRTKTSKYNYMLRAVLALSSETQKSKNPKIQNLCAGPETFGFFGFPTEIATKTVFSVFQPKSTKKKKRKVFTALRPEPLRKNLKTPVRNPRLLPCHRSAAQSLRLWVEGLYACSAASKLKV